MLYAHSPTPFFLIDPDRPHSVHLWEPVTDKQRVGASPIGHGHAISYHTVTRKASPQAQDQALRVCDAPAPLEPSQQ